MKQTQTKRAVIIGATSGIGYETALRLLKKGWKLGVAGRRIGKLKEIQAISPSQIAIRRIDICQNNASDELMGLIDELGGMDLFIQCAGIGYQNPTLNTETELDTVATNAEGFVRMTNTAFHYFEAKGGGHICAISSIAGTKGLGAAPAYSATKRFQNIYIDCLEQLAHIRKCRIRFTDIRPGFVATDLLNDGKHYPMLMKPEKAARRIVSAIERRKRIEIIDWRYRALVFLWKMIPRWMWVRLPVRN